MVFYWLACNYEGTYYCVEQIRLVAMRATGTLAFGAKQNVTKHFMNLLVNGFERDLWVKISALLAMNKALCFVLG